MEQSDQPGAVVSTEGLGPNETLVERLRQERRATAWTRGLDVDYPTAWEPNLLAHEAAQEIERLRATLDQKHAEYEDLKQTMHNMTRNHALQLEAARMAGVHSVQEQTAVIVRAALELLESIEGETPFTAEAVRAFRRVFGA